MTQQRKWTDDEPRVIGVGGPQKVSSRQTAKSAGMVAFKIGLVVAVLVLVSVLMLEFLRQPRTTDSINNRLPAESKPAPDEPNG